MLKTIKISFIFLTLALLAVLVVVPILAAAPVRAEARDIVDAAPALVLAQAAVACESDVVVQANDSLSKLAAKFYGDPKAYVVIVEATNAAAAADSSYATLADPNVIEVGQKLCIPSAADAQTMMSGQTAAAPAAVTSTKVITEGSQGCVTHLQDGANAVMTQLSRVRGIRYCEISVICGSQAAMYNTTTLNNLGNPMDTCDPKLWAGVDETALAAQLDVPGVWKNGPRFWTNDFMEIATGLDNPLDFNGLKAGWFAYPKYPPNIQNLGITAGAYITTTVQRSSVMTFTAGSPIFIMDDPGGNPWVMQAAAQIVNPNLTYGDLATLDTQLHMPEGWSYRVKTIDQDLVIVAVNGFAQITQDDLGNSYDGCIELDGQPTCNFVP